MLLSPALAVRYPQNSADHGPPDANSHLQQCAKESPSLFQCVSSVAAASRFLYAVNVSERALPASRARPEAAAGHTWAVAPPQPKLLSQVTFPAFT